MADNVSFFTPGASLYGAANAAMKQGGKQAYGAFYGGAYDSAVANGNKKCGEAATT